MKKLKEEGITKEFLEALNMANNYSPVQLRVGEEPVKLMECAKGYWVVLEYGKYLKDENGKMVVIDKKEAKIGRARYLINFKEQVEKERFDSAVKEEHDKLVKLTSQKAQETRRTIKDVLIIGGKLEAKGLDGIHISLQEKMPNFYERKKACEQLATDELLAMYERLTQLIDSDNMDSIYVFLFQDNLPELIRSTGKDIEFEVMKEMFHKDNISSTVDRANEKGHLYMLAEIKVRKSKFTE